MKVTDYDRTFLQALDTGRKIRWFDIHVLIAKRLEKEGLVKQVRRGLSGTWELTDAGRELLRRKE